MSPMPLIIDADMGGDDVWLIAATLMEPRYKVLGISTVFGNIGVERATRNATSLLSSFNRTDIPVHQGMNEPIQAPLMIGDDAFGEDGFGGVKLGASYAPASKDAVDWMAGVLCESLEPITVFASGPLTNIAALIQDYPNAARKIKHIRGMFGAIAPGPTPVPPTRIGNITEFAEFNAFQDPQAVNVVAASGIPMTVMMMDATQRLSLDAKRAHLMEMEPMGKAFVKMIRAAEHYDTTKFGSDGPFMHDPQILVQALSPHFYARSEPVKMTAVVDAQASDKFIRHGLIQVTPDPESSVRIVRDLSAQPTAASSIFMCLYDRLKKAGRHMNALTV